MPSFADYIPTSPDIIEGFFELAPVSSSDVVYDLGSGDGRLLFAALDKGAGRAVGIELDPEMVYKATEIARSRGLEGRATFLKADVLDVSLTDATLVLGYLDSNAANTLKSKLESELREGTRVVIEFYPIPGWQPDAIIAKPDIMLLQYVNFYLYTMPPRRAA